jgi:methionyl-tRNA formyltransferase
MYLRGYPPGISTQSFSCHKGRDFPYEVSVRILFLGTPEFACPSLEGLNEREEIVGVITQPDRPSGRGRRFAAPAVKRLAEEKGIPLYQPGDVNRDFFINQMRRLKPDLVVLVAFGQLLGPNFLSIPRLLTINLHPSLLPRYRGPSPIPWAIINGERETGVTVQKVEKELDKGGIILQKKVPIDPLETAADLERELSFLGAELLGEAIEIIKRGQIQYRSQNETEATYAPKIEKADSLIDWSKSALTIHNLVRGSNSYPGASTFVWLRGKRMRIKIWRTELLKENSNLEKDALVGQIIQICKPEGFLVKGGDVPLLVKEVQLPNRNPISGYDFIKGYQIKKGFILGDS